MIELRNQLSAVHPALPYLLLAFVVGALVWLWRTAAPKSFDKLPKWMQHLPAIVLGAVLSAITSGEDIGKALVDALLGAISGGAAIGGHHAFKAFLPGYVGGRYPAAGKAKD